MKVGHLLLATAIVLGCLFVIGCNHDSDTAHRTEPGTSIIDSVPLGDRGFWIKLSANPEDYTMMVDHSIRHSGNGSGVVRSSRKGAHGFATLMQTIDAERYRGKRIRLSANIKCDSVQEKAGLWMRIDGRDSVLGFDNMDDRPIKGTTDWKQYDVVLDVPQNSNAIVFGILLAGEGVSWIDDVVIESVDGNVPTTGPTALPTTTIEEKEAYKQIGQEHHPTHPYNLDFEAQEI